MTDTELLNELLEVERRGWDALCSSEAADFYGALMTDDAVMVLADGTVLDRAEVVTALRHSPPWHAFDIDDPRLVRVGADGYVLVYVGTAYREVAEPAFRGAMASTYLRTPQGWRLTCYQQTPLR
ncbi:nuclear transport factor 2 family protein [Nocardia bovistercoris]|uniref:Nuclear transport factor 2 family protein n=1 Tax=Nocardia bovistercoris TaxID=2785916 RepID=A0A931IDY9_9NOCA|nr:nuclear transport factor 2 family protein [Nocardia bovistercoris]MBH0779694.1 nuclear transport factor 2 family protein [Nocardia bovistercoris]